MSLITIDFETYYTDDVGFRTQTTEEYIRDPRFEVIGVAVQVDDGEPQWFSGDKAAIQKWLRQFDWKNNVALAHNMVFDGAILHWVFGLTPSMMLDTLCMARALHGVDAGGSLAKLAERYQIGVKGDEVVAAKGKARGDFTPEELARYGQYCCNDVRLTYDLFKIMSKGFPVEELQLIDMTLRMFTHPLLYVDQDGLQARLDELREEKIRLLASLKEGMKAETEEEVREKLSSNKKFADVLKSFDIEPPMKISPTTGKETWALAKKDEGFIALTEHDDPFIQQLCAVRLGTKSTLEEKRIERFMDVGKRNRGRIPIPLKYYGAHTGRWSGLDSVNLQNLPSRDKKKKALKNAIMAPAGHYVINCDSSQIEARVLAWLAGQDDVVKQFANGEDVYSVFASKIYKQPISKAHPVERFVGKTCILGLGYGTGAAKLRHTLKTQPPGAVVSEDEAKRIVDLYRQENDKIPALWRECDNALGHLAAWPTGSQEYTLGEHNAVWVSAHGIRLPNGLYIRYPKLMLENRQYFYESRKGKVSIWGGAMVENIVQALARIIVGEQMLQINKRYRPVLTVHDAAVCVVPTSELQDALVYITSIMSTPPAWAAGLPVACEAKFGQSYGEC